MITVGLPYLGQILFPRITGFSGKKKGKKGNVKDGWEKIGGSVVREMCVKSLKKKLNCYKYFHHIISIIICT